MIHRPMAVKQSPTRLSCSPTFKAPPSEHNYLTRKSVTGPVNEDGDPTGRLQWKPASLSALKKATKLYEQRQRKAAKGDQLAIREKEEAEKRAAVLEEAKKIRITQDLSLPKATRVFLDEKDPKIIQLRKGKQQHHEYIPGGSRHASPCSRQDTSLAATERYYLSYAPRWLRTAPMCADGSPDSDV